MKLIKFKILCLFMCLLSFGLLAQGQTQTESIEEGSISEKFDYVIRKSSNWNDKRGQPYEVINRNLVFTLKSQVLDSLNNLNTTLSKSNQTVNSLESDIQRLTTELSQVQEILDSTEKEKNSMSFFGVQMSKSSYRFWTWTIIGILLALLIYLFLNDKRSRIIANTAKKRLSELEKEFDDHKRISLEREQKIKRQLQDEINKGMGSV